MKIFYDTEFIDDGKTLELISVGMVRDDGQELYLINAEVNLYKLARHEWLMSNVVPHLPLRDIGREAARLEWDDSHSDYARVLTRGQMAALVSDFIKSTSAPELWGYYAAYDHVILRQLFGPMTEAPSHIPWFTYDLMQASDRAIRAWGTGPTPFRPEHHALIDARWTRAMYNHLFVV